MKFLLHAQVDQHTIGTQLGTADYSYFFLLRAFAEVLPALGDVIPLQDPAQADAIHAQSLAVGERCVLLSFAPPHKTPLGLSCPVVPVFAWEYPDIPERIEERCWLNDARHDWRFVLASTGRAIALSNHTVEAVQRSMGRSYPIVAIPSPIKPVALRQDRIQLPPRPEGVPLRLKASVADSRRMGLDVHGLIYFEDDDGTPFQPSDLKDLPEPPASNAGGQADDPSVESLLDEPVEPGWSPPPICGWDLPDVMPILTSLHGVIYTAVLTPSAGRKNWEDLISGFCWTFRDTQDATLLLKLSGDDLTLHHHQLLMLLSKMAPLKCRIIAINGYLSDDEYATLIDATTYYVNTSLCEGLCLPLVEFLSEGIPALAPDNTAMADYISADVAFVVASYPGVPTVWPHGDDEVNRTSCHQLNWESLTRAYQDSYHVACHDPARYAEMSRQAHASMQRYCGAAAVISRLQAFLCPELEFQERQPPPSAQVLA